MGAEMDGSMASTVQVSQNRPTRPYEIEKFHPSLVLDLKSDPERGGTKLVSAGEYC